MHPYAKQGIVYLIGAGPGDPGLITVRGVECLRRAQVVIYDYLANPLLLRESPEAEHIYVGKSPGRHHTPQENINALLLEHARRGKIVARLKGGDPFIFGRGGEEAICLSRAGIPFEIVPGVTAAVAAGAYAGIPLTQRGLTTSLAFVTGHEDPAKKLSGLDWQALAGVGTLAFYMGVTNLGFIAERLMAFGRSPDTPVALVRWATTPRQQTLVATLGTAAERVREAGFKPPAVILIGEVVGLREELRWYDRRPLFGRRILVTRAVGQAGTFASMLEARGAETISCPVIEFAPPADWTEVDEAIDRLPQTHFLILTSANAVDFFFGRLRRRGKDARALGAVQVVAVGTKTAEAIEAHGITADLVPKDFRAEGIVEILRSRVAGRRVLYPRAELSRDLITRELSSAGAQVAAPVLYRTVLPAEGKAALEEVVARGVDAVTFTSSSTVENFLALAGSEGRKLLENTVVVSIGPLTTQTALRHGLTVAVEADPYTLEAMAEAITDHFSSIAPQFPDTGNLHRR